MAMLVNKTFLVDTDDVDEANELTKPTSDKVGTVAIGQIRPYDDSAQPTKQKAQKSETTGATHADLVTAQARLAARVPPPK